ncbi:hypothetical protein MHBO_004002 [Bonamia ostreae]|uniref:Phlebovirus glycoprotein G2 fusion domain-containing protein n=1 Tax=Bonamia ostreae TaxID=126728 RepID=A0ABV2ASN1_9EUKA
MTFSQEPRLRIHRNLCHCLKTINPRLHCILPYKAKAYHRPQQFIDYTVTTAVNAAAATTCNIKCTGNSCVTTNIWNDYCTSAATKVIVNQRDSTTPVQ